MMFVDNNFYDHKNTIRLSVGFAVAICLHIIILAHTSNVQSKKTIAADLFSSPTNVTIHLTTPITKQPKIVKKTPPTKNNPIKKKVVKKKTAQVTPKKSSPNILNEIEPAAAIQPKLQPAPAPSPAKVVPIQKSIPIVNERNLKGRRVAPKYPARAERMGQEGVVWLRVLISETGARQDIKIHKPSQYTLLNQAAIKAVRKWTFSPNIVGGKATKSWVEIPIEFKIQ